jgi:hypothetical protein
LINALANLVRGTVDWKSAMNHFAALVSERFTLAQGYGFYRPAHEKADRLERQNEHHRRRHQDIDNK